MSRNRIMPICNLLSKNPMFLRRHLMLLLSGEPCSFAYPSVVMFPYIFDSLIFLKSIFNTINHALNEKGATIFEIQSARYRRKVNRSRFKSWMQNVFI